ncbi:MAG: rhodanese-like domain-containing protein [Myxococcales bacterium]|nr:rhodanese-like domain-containing protein [Myxococcales bacterium]
MQFRTLLTVISLAALSACARSAAPAPATATTTQAAAANSEQERFRRMSVEELSRAMAANEAVTVIDNNGRERYEQGHIPSARHVGHDEVTPAVLPADRAARLVFYCYNESCHACHNAANQALNLGYTNVFILPAGITGWQAANQRVVSGPNPS